MKKLLCLFVLLLVIRSGAGAQDGNFPKSKPNTGTIFGKVVATDEPSGLAYANVLLFKLHGQKPVRHFTTREGGRFIFRSVPYGTYRLEINFTGMEPLVIEPLKVTAGQPHVELETLTLVPENNQISEVVVVADRSDTEFGLATKRYNVNKDINNAGSTAQEILRNIPSVFVDEANNTVQLRGSSNVAILINGRKSAIAGSGSSLRLDKIPAADIEAIEVITNPSAKYEAAGKAGIINIILKRPHNMGFNYSLNVMAGTADKWSASYSANYRTRHFNWQAGYSFDRKRHDFSQTLSRHNILPDTSYFLDQLSGGNKLKISHSIRAGVDWMPTKKWTVFSSFTFLPHHAQKPGHYHYIFYDQDRMYDSSRERYTRDNEATGAWQAELGFDKSFDRKGMKWSAVVTYDKGTKADSVAIRETTYINENPMESGESKNRRRQKDGNLRFQTDWKLPLRPGWQLQTGALYSDRHLENDFRYFNLDNDLWYLNWDRTNDFTYDERIAAAYVMADGQKGRFSWNGGLRYEYTALQSGLANDTTHINYYGHLFPSGSLTFAFDEQGRTKLSLSYSKRIHRPSYRRLNPFVSYNDEQNVRRGNPALQPELTDALELGMVIRRKAWSLNPTVFYRATRDKIGYYAQLLPNGARLLTFVNLNRSVSLGTELNGQVKIARPVRLSGSVSFFRVEKDGENLTNPASNAGNMLMARLALQVNPVKRLSVQLTGFYHTGFIGTVGYSDPMKDMDIALKYSVLRRRGQLILRLTDLFNTRQFGFHVRTVDINMDYIRKRESRILWLGFNWQLKQQDRAKRRHHKSGEGMEMEM